MTDLAADLLAAWVVATAACSVLLVLVVAVQDVLGRVRRRALRHSPARGRAPGLRPAARTR